MKIMILLLGVTIISLTSFTKNNLDEKYTEQTIKSSSIIQISGGEKLIAKSDCIGCHNKVKKVVGPSYIDIASKYKYTEKNVAYLANKIIKGGSGVWGTIPMGPHVSLKNEEAKLMVKYILSLKKK
jgi:cytochrome c